MYLVWAECVEEKPVSGYAGVPRPCRGAMCSSAMPMCDATEGEGGVAPPSEDWVGQPRPQRPEPATHALGCLREAEAAERCMPSGACRARLRGSAAMGSCRYSRSFALCPIEGATHNVYQGVVLVASKPADDSMMRDACACAHQLPLVPVASTRVILARDCPHGTPDSVGSSEAANTERCSHDD